jgi:hypothetical protein
MGFTVKRTTETTIHREPGLLERTNTINAEQDEEIARHIETLKTYGVPMAAIENIFWAKVPGGRCRCSAIRRIGKETNGT